MPQHNMESTRSQWQQGMRPPWISRVAGGQSPASSGAESDTESSSTESEKVSEGDEAGDGGVSWLCNAKQSSGGKKKEMLHQWIIIPHF